MKAADETTTSDRAERRLGTFLVVTWDGAGNLWPTLGIAHRLAQRGHDVRLLGHESIERRYGDRGWRFLAFEHTADFDSTVVTDVDAELRHLAEKLWFSPSVARDVAADARTGARRRGVGRLHAHGSGSVLARPPVSRPLPSSTPRWRRSGPAPSSR